MASPPESTLAKESSRDSSPSGIVENSTAQQPSDVEKSLPATSNPDPNAPPDGGLAAWTTVLGGFCCVFASFGWVNCMYIFRCVRTLQLLTAQASVYSKTTTNITN